MADSEKGCVYILTNPAFRDNWVKIGMSSDCDPRVRAGQLYTTGVPLPFEVYGALQTAKYAVVEKLLHYVLSEISGVCVNEKREFFEVEPAKALETLRRLSLCMEDAELVTSFDDPSELSSCELKEESVVDSRGHSNRFAFSRVGISVGEKVVFTPAKIEAVVASDNQVQYDGHLYRLSPFCARFMPDACRNASNSYQGCRFFEYKGRLLYDLFQEVIRYEEEGL